MTIKALVFDDEKDIVTNMLKLLQSWFEATEFSYLLERDLDAGLASIRDEMHDPNGFDVVFLDIAGFDIDPADPDAEPITIPSIRSVNPYLPVVMFSAQGTVQNILTYMDRGASLFLLKAELEQLGVDPLDESGQAGIQRGRLKYAQRIRKVVEQYKPIKHLLASLGTSSGTVRKSGPSDELDEQIRFLEAVAQIPETAGYFPCIVGAYPELGFRKHTFYQMPFYEMKNLHSFLLAASTPEVCLDVAKKTLQTVLDGPFRALTLQHRVPVKSLTPKKLHSLYFGKFDERTTDVQQKVEAAGENAEPLACEFVRLLTCERIEIGGDSLLPPAAIIAQLDAILTSKRGKRYRPSFLSLVHGDLHFRNILLDDRLLLMMPIKLIDPRGKSWDGSPGGIGDPAFDVAKLLHCSHGKAFFIHDKLYGPPGGRWNISWEGGGKTAVVPKFQKSSEGWAAVGGGLSKSSVSVRRPRVQEWIWDVCEKLTDCIVAEAGRVLADDPYWKLRADLYEPMLLCQSAPQRLESDPEAAISLYLQGTILLNDFWEQHRND